MLDLSENIPKILLKDYLLWVGLVEDGKWDWINNSRCKYVTTTVDSRSNWLVVLDRYNKPLKRDELFFQWSDKE